MDAVNFMPMPNAAAAGTPSKAQAIADTGKNAKSTGAFTNVLNNAVDQKALLEQVKNLQGNLSLAVNNLEPALAALFQGLFNGSGAEPQNQAQVSKDAVDGEMDPQALGAIMALLGGQMPALAQNAAVKTPEGTAELAENISGASKGQDVQVPFAALQGKVLASMSAVTGKEDAQSKLNVINLQDNAGNEANQAEIMNAVKNVLLQNMQQQSAQPQNMILDMNAAKVQVVAAAAGMSAKQSEQADSGVKDSTEKSASLSKASLVDKTMTSETTTQPKAEEALNIKSVSMETNQTVQPSVNNLLPHEDTKEQGEQSSADGDEQPALFSNIIAQHTDKTQHAAHVTQADMPKAHDPYNVKEQIVDHAKLFKQAFDSNSSEMLIKLNPEHLGELTLKVAVDNGVITASFHTNNAEVRSIIEASLPQLKQDMANQGLKVDNVDVYAGMSDFFSGSQQGELFRQQQEQQQKSAKLKNLNRTDDFVEAVEEQSSPKVAGADGVDYRV